MRPRYVIVNIIWRMFILLRRKKQRGRRYRFCRNMKDAQARRKYIKMWSKCYSKTHFMLCMIPSSTCRSRPQWCAQADPGPLPWCVTRQSRHPHLDGHRQRGRRGARSSPTCSVMFWVCIIVCCDIIMILNNFKQFPYCRWG